MTAKRAQCVVSSGISVIFQLGWVPSRRTYLCQNVVALYYDTKDIFFPAIKCEKNLFIYVGRVSNKLKDVIS